MTKTTRRKVKIIGYEQYINKATGEVADFQVIDIAEKDANFHKFWLFNVINSLDLIGNKKMKFAFWLIENMDSSNKISWTMRQMAEKSGVSLDTVRITMRALMDSNFLVKQNIANYQINPEAIFKGGKDKRLRILLDYHEAAASQNIAQNATDSHTSDFSQSSNTDIPKAKKIAQNATDSHTSDFSQSSNTDIPKAKKIAQNASQEVSEIFKYPRFTYNNFMKLKPEKLINIKKTQYWVLTINEKKQVYRKNGKFFVNFLTTNPNENIKNEIEMALDKYEDYEAESSVS